jgi:hypothetical protein
MRLVEHVAYMARVEMHTKFWWETLREMRHLEAIGVGEIVMLKWII